MSDMPLFEHASRRGDGDGPEDRVLRVSELNRAVRLMLEKGFADLWVEGELSDVTRSAAGHVYFSLNDGNEPAQVRGVMFRTDASRARAKLANGARVRLRGRLSLYEPRGSFQLIATVALPAGAGDLAAQLEKLKRKLEAEGLFDVAKKRTLPRFPKVIGVVTSTSGAAMHDVLRVARGRAPVRIVVADCRVQGEGAPATIVAALAAIQRLPGLDVVILGRGGGGSDDLGAFNDEAVVRAVARCRVPIVSAVGHEVDVTLTDFAADVRAATPSNAAELVVPDRRALAQELEGLERRMVRALEVRVGRDRLRLERLGRALEDPRHALAGVRTRLEQLVGRLRGTLPRSLPLARRRLVASEHALRALDPRATLGRDRARLVSLLHRLEHAGHEAVARRRPPLDRLAAALSNEGSTMLEGHRARLRERMAQLHALSPLGVLERGYAIALHATTGRAIRRADEVRPGDRFTLRLAEGSVSAKVEE